MTEAGRCLWYLELATEFVRDPHGRLVSIDLDVLSQDLEEALGYGPEAIPSELAQTGGIFRYRARQG